MVLKKTAIFSTGLIVGALIFFAYVFKPYSAPAPIGSDVSEAHINTLISRLTLANYKDTIKGLTTFGDRMQGTKRNEDALDWIETQLKSYGCSDVERLDFENTDTVPQTKFALPLEELNPPGGTVTGGVMGRNGSGPGGASQFGFRGPTSKVTDPDAQPDETLRELNRESSSFGKRQEIYCTKIGSTHPDEMYIIGAHMDGIGRGEAVNDDASGTALVMELARIFSSPDVKTKRSIRFILFNNEEAGLLGSIAYAKQRYMLQGKEEPAGSGKYPEPKWLGMIQHDMMLFDHGAPRADGTVSKSQRPEADVNIEFQSQSKLAKESRELAFLFKDANDKYATDYPANVGPHMINTDSRVFQDFVPSISLRENERGAHIGAGWNPHWHQHTDMFINFTDDDFRLGLNAGQTTLSALSQLTGLTVKTNKSKE